MDPEQKLDNLLAIIKDRSRENVPFSKTGLWENSITHNPDLSITEFEFVEMINFLHDEGYLRRTLIPDFPPTYNVSFKGLVFEGYAKRAESLDAADRQIKYLQQKSESYTKNLNDLTAIIAVGTLCAAFYYILEIYKSFPLLAVMLVIFLAIVALHILLKKKL